MPATQISAAAVKGDLEELAQLVESDRGIVNARGEDAVTPLHMASFKEHDLLSVSSSEANPPSWEATLRASLTPH